MKTFEQQHPSMCEVGEMFDVYIVIDRKDDEDIAHIVGPNTKAIFALGQRPEISAGLRGFTMTPYFSSLDELEAFCARNLQRFKDIIAADEDAPAPDATSWE